MTAIKMSGLLALLVGTAAVAATQLPADKNGDGVVSLSEYQQAASDMAAKRFARLDKNGDGQLTPDELQAARHPGRRPPLAGLLGPDGKISIADLEARRPKASADELQALDTNHDGMLTRDELNAGREKMAEERIKKIDSDGDGNLSLAELQAVHPNLTEEQFNRLDRNSDGLIEPEELPGGRLHGFSGAR
ncbi:MAG TPA: hypothetical protein VFY39_07580 [Gammaproteobacteria bacterium]|nr:hypothetical protein [Gammaproteobacteria bacterium]